MRHYNLKRNIKRGGGNGGLRGRPPRRGGARKTRLGRDKGEARSKTVKANAATKNLFFDMAEPKSIA